MSIRIKFVLRPKNRITSFKRWRPKPVEEMVRQMAEEQGYTCEHLSCFLLCKICPEGYIWFRWDKGKLRAESQTNIVGPGFHVTVIEFMEQLAERENLKLKAEDRTGYFWRRDFLAMRRQYFYQWFTDLMNTVSEWSEDQEYTFCWPARLYYPDRQKGKLITHIRSFSFTEIRSVVNSGLSMAFAKDFFIWNEIEKDALYYRNYGLVLLNQNCNFMPSSRSESDRTVNKEIIEALETAFSMDSRLPFPKKEYLEVCRLAEHEPLDVSQAEPLPGDAEVGCRKHLVYRSLGNMSFALPGHYLFEENSESSMDHYYDGLDYGGHDFYIYAVVLGIGGQASFKDAWFEQGTPEQDYFFEAEGGKGRVAIYAPETKDGEVLYKMSAQVLYEEQRTNVNITCRKPGEMEWALELVKKIKVSE